jgi:hypothetical protein
MSALLDRVLDVSVVAVVFTTAHFEFNKEIGLQNAKDHALNELEMGVVPQVS